MKTVAHFPLLCAAALFALAACKKNDAVSPQANAAQADLQMAAEENGWHLPLTVKTIAGSVSESGYVDGKGKEARFSFADGIDVMDDGTLYVADRYNDKIRKITPDGVVSTVNIPKNNEGHELLGPSTVRVQKNGTINILTYDVYFVTGDKIWIIKPNGDVLTPKYKTSPDNTLQNLYTYNDLQRDPYSDFLLIGGIFRGYTGMRSAGVIERFEINDNKIGTNAFHTPIEAFDSHTANTRITSFFSGYNGVKYIVIDQKQIFKLTKSGVFERIYKNLSFQRITSIVANKDSRTLYIAELGKLMAITNGKLVFLAGQQKPHDGGDGVGSSADVGAHKLALSKDEGTLYFTNNSSVRKMLLR
ncbi:hypothetical protein IM792_15415 [Mucilaginibacter sp. JRF]|uniref:hypothetical protein n=1 Tax=Mucilaginibacter sp. JRF TaxID=2780088 RepID=UPI0018812E09|nr:hypothetical protein [Mucilaginibacter sp. JRF]MBE9585844.1 hypothetical protein [Mucilaginibacter sp. JRF]